MKQTKRKIKISWRKGEKKIFGAFKWNAYVTGMYEDVFEKIKGKHGWEAQYGSKYLLKVDKNWKKSIKPEDIEEFINRNKQLYEIFVKGISACDLFIADITNHNPNVLLELGIAIQMDKNILVVTGQDIKDIPFDIRGYEAKKYNSKKELYEIIEKEIQIFDLIKDQTFKPGEFISSKRHVSNQKGVLTNKQAVKIENISKLKNLRIKVDFRFLYSSNHKWDWFGVHLRSQKPAGFFSELALVRYTGETRSVTWPEQRKENDGQKVDGFKPEDWRTLEIIIDENRLTMWVHQQLVLDDQELLVENFGEIYIRCNDHHNPAYFNNEKAGEPKDNDVNKDVYLEVEYRNIEVLDLSTTASLFE